MRTDGAFLAGFIMAAAVGASSAAAQTTQHSGPCTVAFVAGPNGQVPTLFCNPQGVSATEPRYGSPNSIQFQAADSALSLADFDADTIDVEGPDGDADTIGGAFTYYGAGGIDGERLDLRYRRARRLGEGSRARLLLEGVVNINRLNEKTYTVAFPTGPGTTTTLTSKVGGETAIYGTISAGVEFPVQPNWVITPRVNYSNLQAGNYFGRDAEQIGASVTSRAKLGNLGRGDLVLGNSVAYAHTLDTFLADQPFFFKEDYWAFRNGIAYQAPLNMRMGGRQTSLRGSYVFTYLAGAPGLAFKQIHEVGISIGIRAREVEQKSGFEKLRVGLLYTHGKNEFAKDAGYDAVTLTLGYRF